MIIQVLEEDKRRPEGGNALQQYVWVVSIRLVFEDRNQLSGDSIF